ncbi:MAG: hypothetical protein HY709_04390 [Candidatus Latescibacteria bacterium]|nr:hypothetical protein [Candidatus Latescibacterota bacterium]
MVFCLFLIALFEVACSDRERTNPLDPRNPITGGRPPPPQAVAGDRIVTLSWDFSSYTDIIGYRLYKRRERHPDRALLFPLSFPASIHSTVDSSVTNGSTYLYSITLISPDKESESSLEVPSTPGPEVCWVTDAGSGCVVRISPDGRQVVARIEGFQNPTALAVHPADGNCWVVDDELDGVYRVTQEHVAQHVISLEDPTDLSIEADGLAWIIEAQRVVYVSTEQLLQPAPQIVDANFLFPFSIASTGNHSCWIADYEGNRVILYDVLSHTIDFSVQDIPVPRLLVADMADSACWIVHRDRLTLSKVSLRSRSILFSIEGLGRIYGIAVNRKTGHCWVATAHQVYRLSRDGRIEITAEISPDIVAVSVNSDDGTCWAISRNTVYKLTPDGTILSSAGGMLYLTDVAIDPGR